MERMCEENKEGWKYIRELLKNNKEEQERLMRNIKSEIKSEIKRINEEEK